MHEDEVTMRFVYIHRVLEWFGMEGTLKIILFQPLSWAGTASTIVEIVLSKDNDKL